MIDNRWMMERERERDDRKSLLRFIPYGCFSDAT